MVNFNNAFVAVEIREQVDRNKLSITKPPRHSYAYVQLHGSRLCIDLHCTCGSTGHLDDEFLFLVKCVSCSRTYRVIPYLKIDEIRNKELANKAKEYSEA